MEKNISNRTTFSYCLPDGLNTKTYITPDGNIKFEPPLFEQRYMTAVRIIEDERWKQQLKKIVDFGCAEMRLMPLLRRIPHVEHILEVDTDGSLLSLYQRKAVPLIADYLKRRENPLRIEVLQGSITDAVEQLYDVNAVIGLEIIEHLHKEVLEKVPENIFGFIQPNLAIFSTPNSDYNPIFGQMLVNGFRHDDHKFEWSRKEFRAWADTICKNYPNYKVSFIGLGEPPDGQEKLGHATQVAIFARNDMIDLPLCTNISKKPITSEAQYKTILVSDFPYNEDKRSTEQKIIDETKYFISQAKTSKKYFYPEMSVYRIPWESLFDQVKAFHVTVTDFVEILKNHSFEVQRGYIIATDDYDDHDSDDLDYNGEYNLEAQPYRYNINDEDEEKLASNLASDCNIVTPNVNDDTEEEWD